MAGEPVHVAAGVITDSNGCVLLARRLPDTHLAGKWEFPGGKLESGETPLDGLRRELWEELAVDVQDARPLISFEYRYPDKHVKLDVFRISQYSGELRAVEGHELDWVSADKLRTVDLLEADKPIVTAIVLPDHYAVSSDFSDADGDSGAFLSALDATIFAGYKMIQIRTPRMAAPAKSGLYEHIALRCKDSTAWLVNGDPVDILESVQEYGASGIHMPARYLDHYRARPIPDNLIFGVSCHDRDELNRACDLDADFAVLGSVNLTPSHPRATPIGWEQFAALIDGLPLPVYAIGGIKSNDCATAWARGAQGVAGISDFWAASR